MKILTIIIFLLVCMPAMLFADVIRLQNGQIFLGRVIRADSNGIVTESFGEQREFSQAEILKNEKDLSTLKNTALRYLFKGRIYTERKNREL